MINKKITKSIVFVLIVALATITDIGNSNMGIIDTPLGIWVSGRDLLRSNSTNTYQMLDLLNETQYFHFPQYNNSYYEIFETCHYKVFLVATFELDYLNNNHSTFLLTANRTMRVWNYASFNLRWANTTHFAYYLFVLLLIL